MRKPNRFRLPALGLPLIVALWAAAELLGWTHPLFFPDLTKVGSALIDQVLDSALWIDVFVTVYRALIGLAISLVLGLPLGLFLGRSFALYRHVSLPLDFVRSIPAATLFPLFILVFGIGNVSKIAVVVYGCTFIILVAAIYGARSTPAFDPRTNMMRSLRASSSQIYSYVIIPVALENILSGLRIATSVAFVLVVITEMFLGSNDGLGKRIYDLYLAYRVPEMFATLIVLGLVGYVANRAIETIEFRYKRRIGAQRK